jgi:outer membrane protein OmpA-like peptidoglycan-associated protein
MAESLFTSLLHTLDKSSISEIASSLGESEQNVSRGMESSIASILAAVASKSDNPAGLRHMLDLVPGNLEDITWSKLASGVAGNPSWLQTSKQLLSSISPSGHTMVASALSKDCGTSTGTAISLLGMAAPMVLTFLNRQIQEQGLSIKGFGAVLQREVSAIRSALPAGIVDLFWPREAATLTSPVIAQSVQRDKTSTGWIGALALSAALMGSFWLWTHGRRLGEGAANLATGSANRIAAEGGSLGDFVKRELPSGVEMKVPADGMESRLVGIINGTYVIDQSSWLDCDRLAFDSGSDRLRPGSSEQLDNIAAIMTAYPNVRLKLAGYTDSVGTAEQDIQLSRTRAEKVKEELVSRGISPDRLTTVGFGETSLADNSTAAGRAHHRRVAVQVALR